MSEQNTPNTPQADLTVLAASIEALNRRFEGMDAVVKQFEGALASPAVRSGFVLPGDTRSEGPDERAVKSFNRYIRTGVKAALQEDTASEGGYLVPSVYSSELVTALNEMSVLRMAGARVMQVSGTNSFKVPTIINSPAAVLTGEEGAFDQQEPTFSQVPFTPYKYTRLSKASDELLEDSGTDVMRQVLLPDFAQAFASAENTAFATGTGSDQPQGVVSGGTKVDTATAETFAADDIITLYHALPSSYRQRAVWLLNDVVAAQIRTFKESTTGQYLWQPGLQAGQPDTLLGRPVYTLNTMDSDTTTAGKHILLFGDLSYFWIVDFGMESIRRLDELYAANGQVGFRMYKRIDSNVMVSEAIQILRVKATV